MAGTGVCARLRSATERYLDIWQPGTTDAEAEGIVAQVFSPDATLHTFLPWAPTLTTAQLLDAWKALRRAMPKCFKTLDTFTCNEATGDVMLKYTFTGNFSGEPLYTFRPTHKLLSVSGVIRFKFREGRIVCAESYLDTFSAFHQLGVELEKIAGAGTESKIARAFHGVQTTIAGQPGTA